MADDSGSDDFDHISHADTALSAGGMADIHGWLQPTDYASESSEYSRHIASQSPGTGLWICETEEYKKWHNSTDHGSLWVKGVPGAGKSVTAASLIKHLRETENHPVLYFFFRNIVAANFSPRALIKDWLAQLLPHSPQLQYELKSRMEDDALDDLPDSELFQIFLEAASRVPKVYCVADALDEMSVGSHHFLKRMNALATFRPAAVKLLIMSRPKQYLQSVLRDTAIVHISLQEKLVNADIVSYLNHRFEHTQLPDRTHQYKDQLINMVAEKSQGLFLIAKLTMDQVISTLNDESVDLANFGHSLPVGLEQTYTSMLAKSRRDTGITLEAQIYVLQAVTHAARPLRLNELASLMKCVFPQLTGPNGSANLKALVAGSCGPLIEILEDETLQVIHHSLTEFLRGDTRSATQDPSVTEFPIIHSDQAHKRLALDCLKYLESGALLLEHEHATPIITEESPMRPTKPSGVNTRRWSSSSSMATTVEGDIWDYTKARLVYQFLGYAVENWGYHASHYDVEDVDVSTAISDFITPNRRAFRRWLSLQWKTSPIYSRGRKELPTALHITAFAGLSFLANDFLEAGVEIEGIDAEKRTPLHWAAAKGHAKLVSLLLKHGAHPNPDDCRGLTPIHLATQANHADVVTLLLKAGVSPTAPKTREDFPGRRRRSEKRTTGDCAIFFACQGGFIETIRAVIPFCDSTQLEQLLSQACEFGRHEAVLPILNESKVSVNSKYRGATPLFLACDRGSVQTARILLEHGADVNEKSDREYMDRRRARPKGQSPLHRAIVSWKQGHRGSQHSDLVKLLIEKGADVNAVDGKEATPLSLAGQIQYADHRPPRVLAIKMLIEAGADITTRRGSPHRPLLHDILGLYMDVESVKYLVERGCSVCEKDSLDWSSLRSLYSHYVSEEDEVEKQLEISQLLLDHGADLFETDNLDVTAFELAASCNFKVFDSVFAQCKDEEVLKKTWFSLTTTFEDHRFEPFVNRFLESGFDIDTKDENGRTMLLLSVDKLNRLKFLEANGASIHAIDAKGNHALHLAAKHSQLKMEALDRFLDAGIDPLATNKRRDTLLHLIAKHNSGGGNDFADMLRRVLKLGISVNAVNNEGNTALHCYQDREDNSPVYYTSDEFDFITIINEEKKVDFNIRNVFRGHSVLHLAASSNEEAVIKLVEEGADPTQLTSDGQNLFHIATNASRAGVLGYLLAQYADKLDINQKDNLGRTPLHFACNVALEESVYLLLAHGADIDAEDDDGSTPLHAAALCNPASDLPSHIRTRYDSMHVILPGKSTTPAVPWYQGFSNEYSLPRRTNQEVGNVVRMLMNAGCKAAVQDKSRRTALDIALELKNGDFTTPIYQNEEWFLKATSQLDTLKAASQLDTLHMGNLSKESVRNTMKIQMALLEPSSLPAAMLEDEAVLNSIRANPVGFLDILTPEDMKMVVNEALDIAEEKDTPLPFSYLALVQDVVQKGFYSVVPALSRLLSSFSDNEYLEKMLLRDVKENKLDAKWYHCDSSLHLAVLTRDQSNMHMVRMLVEEIGVDVNAFTMSIYHEGRNSTQKHTEIRKGHTALHVLAGADQYWHLDAMEYLLQKGADVNALNVNGETPLHIASRGVMGHRRGQQGFWKTKAANILLKYGADPEIVDENGLTAVQTACNSPEIMKELLGRGYKFDSSEGSQNPLFLAINQYCVPVVEMLLDYGISVNSLDTKRKANSLHWSLDISIKIYPLLAAAFANRYHLQESPEDPLIALLFAKGADLYLPLNDTQTLLHFLFEYADDTIINILLSDVCLPRIDLHSRDQRGRTLLMAACAFRGEVTGYQSRSYLVKEQAPHMKVLNLGEKIDATAVDNLGKTALHYLLDNQGLPEETMLEFIEREEVKPILLTKDNAGYTPLHYALKNMHPKACQALLERGANLLESDPEGVTALHHVAARCTEFNRTLWSGRLPQPLAPDYKEQTLALWTEYIRLGGDVNSADNSGDTPLLTYLLKTSTEYGAPHDFIDRALETYNTLFSEDSGVDIFATNKKGETALHVICKRDSLGHSQPHLDKKLFWMMMAKGLDPLKEDVEGRSALDIASACDKYEIINLLTRKKGDDDEAKGEDGSDSDDEYRPYRTVPPPRRTRWVD